MLLGAASAFADVRLHPLFSDHAVLQRGVRLPVWGWAAPGEQVTVTLDKQKTTATADARGCWKAFLEPMTAGGPFEMNVTGRNTLAVKDVMIGEVWLASGQSNMNYHMARGVLNGAEEMAKADFPGIRMFTVPFIETAEKPCDTCKGQWAVCSPATVGYFSAVGYFFARELHRKMGVPVGIVSSSVGGTRIEAWMSAAALSSDPGLKTAALDRAEKTVAEYAKICHDQCAAKLRDWLAAAVQAKSAGKTLPPPPVLPSDPRKNQNFPTVLYNALIAPLAPYSMAGVIWYQGESNASNAALYRTLLPTMIRSWREVWGQGDFPFLIVQLANFMAQKAEPSGSAWAELREAQSMALSLPKTGMAVAIDIGEAGDIHPKNKQDVGKRLALAAQSIAYGDTNVVFSGPVYDGMTVEGGKIRLKFKHVGGGLTVRDGGALKGFAVAGEDKKFVWADAAIEGNSVTVGNAAISKPVAVRYAWADNPVCNLCNKEGLPAQPFRTDGIAEKPDGRGK